jgi:hypothetical protein
LRRSAPGRLMVPYVSLGCTPIRDQPRPSNESGVKNQPGQVSLLPGADSNATSPLWPACHGLGTGQLIETLGKDNATPGGAWAADADSCKRTTKLGVRFSPVFRIGNVTRMGRLTSTTSAKRYG